MITFAVAPMMRRMSEPAKPGPGSRIDVNDADQIILLGLSALFTAVAIARGDSAHEALAKASVVCANALIDATIKPAKS